MQDLWGAGTATRYSNMITYATPEFAGAKLYAQYSFGGDVKGAEENKSSSDRYGAVGATFDAGALHLVGVADMVNRASYKPAGSDVAPYDDDMYRIILGGSYDFGFIKPYLGASYFKNGTLSNIGGVYSIKNKDGNDDSARLGYVYDGWAVIASFSAPIGSGTLLGAVGYTSASFQNDATGSDKPGIKGADIDRFMIGASYQYKLSKQTMIYVDAGWMQDSVDSGDEYDGNPSVAQAAFGMVHYF